jgi:DNA polymerase-3 subunit alpha
VGAGAIAHVVKEREENGDFKSLYDLCSRVSSRIVNRRVFESLIQSGALDCLPGHRAQKLHNLETVLQSSARRSREAERGQFSLAFGSEIAPIERELEPAEEWPAQEKLRREREALGFFLTGHPLEKFRAVIDMMGTMNTAALKDSANGKHAVLGGIITNVKTTLDRKQNPMAFVSIEDAAGQAEGVVFSDVLKKAGGKIAQDTVLLLEGKVSRRNSGDGKLLVNSVIQVNDESIANCKELHIIIDMDRMDAGDMEDLKKLILDNKGEAKLFFNMKQNGKSACVIRSRTLSVKLNRDLLSKLSKKVGADNIKIVTGM